MNIQMKEVLKFEVPSGKAYNVLGSSRQSIEVDGDRLIYKWKYTAETLVNTEDPLTGYDDPLAYDGVSVLLHRFYAGRSMSYDAVNENWSTSIRFSGLESSCMLLNSMEEAQRVIDLVDRWHEYNSKKA